MVLTLVWALGQVVRERIPFLELLFYIPSPVVAAGLLLGAFLALMTRRRSAAFAFGAVAMIPLSWTLGVENRLLEPHPKKCFESSVVRVVHWNVFRGKLGWDGVLAAVRAENADLVVFSELPPKADPDATARALGGGYSVIQTGGFGLYARGEWMDGRWLVKSDDLRVYVARWIASGGECRVMIVDLASSLRFPRRAPLLRVVNYIRAEQPDLVLGDFNALRRSAAFDELPPGYRHAYDESGHSWSATWPVPLPLWAIDQCIHGSRIVTPRYELRSTRWSDHRMQIVELFWNGKS